MQLGSGVLYGVVLCVDLDRRSMAWGHGFRSGLGATKRTSKGAKRRKYDRVKDPETAG